MSIRTSSIAVLLFSIATVVVCPACNNDNRSTSNSASVKITDVDETPDLVTPPASEGPPAPGKRVRQVHEQFAGTKIHHLLYLPTDWEPGVRYPVIVEYAGNKYQTSPGTVAGSNLGYGVSGGKGVIWVCLPFVDLESKANAVTWWGDVQATVEYCKQTVRQICREYGGDPDNLFIAGFSRGAIACNHIGLHDDQIAVLWRGFICHSHYDGVRQWPYENSDRTSAAVRLIRLGDRPQFISHEESVDDTREYLSKAFPNGNFTFRALPGMPHSDTWVLYPGPHRDAIRDWFWSNVSSDQIPE